MRKLIAVFLVCCVPGLTAQETIIKVSIADIPARAMSHAPAVKHIENEYLHKKTKTQIATRWQNPEFEYEAEHLTDGIYEEQETAFLIKKQLPLPWVYFQSRGVQGDYFKAAAYVRNAELRNSLAELKTLYAKAQLVNQMGVRLNRLKNTIERLTQFADERFRSGLLSETQHMLILFSLSNIDAKLLKTNQQERALRNRFKTNIGIQDEDKLLLTTQIQYQKIDVSDIDLSLVYFYNTNQFKAHSTQISARKRQIIMEKMKVLPDLNIVGGYKDIGNNFNGYIFGLSLPLPLFDQNQPHIEQSKIAYQNSLLEYDQFKQQVVWQSRHYLESINELSDFFEENGEIYDKMDRTVENAAFAFQKGFVELSDLLNSIEIYVDTLERFNEQLYEYCANVFQLEALLEKELITFN